MKKNKLLCLLYLAALWGAATGAFTATAQVTVPNRWKNVQMLGGGFVSGIVYSPAQQDLLYARTDVGGAYRWDAPAQTWIPLTVHLSRFEQDYTGVVSLAADPSDPNRVYLATGLYTQSWAGTGAILASADKGNTWTTTKLGIKPGGNEDGRSAGERLQVDPNLGSVLYLGSSTDGLWKSTDYGASWAKVNSFAVASSPVGSGGVSFVLFDQRSGTPARLPPRSTWASCRRAPKACSAAPTAALPGCRSAVRRRAPTAGAPLPFPLTAVRWCGALAVPLRCIIPATTAPPVRLRRARRAAWRR